MVAMATATAACPDTNPRPLSWWPRRWTSGSRSAGRPRPTWSLIHLAAIHTPIPVMARLAASQNRRVAATTSAATPTASTLPACITTQNAGNRAVGRSLTSRNRSVSSAPTSSGRTVAVQASRMASPGDQPDGVAGVAGQGQDLAGQQVHWASDGGSSGTLPSVNSLIVSRRASRVTNPRARVTSPRGRACSSLRKSSR